MKLIVHEDRKSLGRAAAATAADTIRTAIRERGNARIVVATAASQMEFLEALASLPDMDWSRVEAFHLDEYIGLSETHPGSFRRMFKEQVIQKTGITRFHLLDGSGDPAKAAEVVGNALLSAPIDITFLGIGENGHLAFNDPPADFETDVPYLIVALDEVCRRQQVGEAWFADLSQVPTHALSMSMRQILKSKELLVVVPDARKAEAVKACFEGEISPMAPASILRTHANVTVFLDPQSASLLNPETLAAAR